MQSARGCEDNGEVARALAERAVAATLIDVGMRGIGSPEKQVSMASRLNERLGEIDSEDAEAVCKFVPRLGVADGRPERPV